MLENVEVSIPVVPVFDMLPFCHDLPLKHTQQEDLITFTIPHEFIWMAKVWGVKITYTKEM